MIGCREHFSCGRRRRGRLRHRPLRRRLRKRLELARDLQRERRRGFLQDPKVVACLKKQGVTIPTRRRGDGGPPNGQNGQPPTGTNRRPPSGQGGPNGPGSAQFQKLREALQKCGVDFRGRPPNGQAPQGQGTTSTSAT